MTEIKTSVISTSQTLVSEGRKKRNAFLQVLSARSAALAGRMFKVDRPEMIIGRSVDTNIQIDDESVSRRHAKIITNGERHEIIDLGSTNGTFLNAARIDAAPLADGDRIQIGRNTVLTFSFKDELEESYQRNIYENATRDGLTRVFNRKFFMDSFRKEFAYCQRHRVPLSVVLFDVDHFKKLNDTYGHPAGDFVLQKMAQRVLDTIRSEDILARYGGEEFIMLVRQCGPEQALACSERTRKAVETTDFNFNGVSMRATISVGLATMLGDPNLTPEDLIAHADRFLYEAKRKGRNRVETQPLPPS